MPEAVPYLSVHRRIGCLALPIVLAGCLPLRVDVSAPPSGGYLAKARGESLERCGEARERVREEAEYFCRVRELEVSSAMPSEARDGEASRCASGAPKPGMKNEA
jgi:hypothetical protein